VAERNDPKRYWCIVETVGTSQKKVNLAGTGRRRKGRSTQKKVRKKSRERLSQALDKQPAVGDGAREPNDAKSAL